MAVLDLAGLSDYTEYLRQQLLEAPDITVVAMRDKLIGAYGVSCSERTMRSWLERARAPIPRRAIQRASSDLPTLESLNPHAEFLQNLLAKDPSIGWTKIREAMKEKGYLVSERTVRNWLDRYHGKCNRALLEAPIDGLPCVDRRGLQPYEAALLEIWDSRPRITYMQMKEFLEQKLGVSCSKRTMLTFMETPFISMEGVSIELLRGEDYLNLLKAIYSDRPHISLYALRMKLAATFGVTAST